jgi:hypothetical protein
VASLRYRLICLLSVKNSATYRNQYGIHPRHDSSSYKQPTSHPNHLDPHRINKAELRPREEGRGRCAGKRRRGGIGSRARAATARRRGVTSGGVGQRRRGGIESRAQAATARCRGVTKAGHDSEAASSRRRRPSVAPP